MIKIIKDGQKEFTAKCDTCGCEFSYQLVDIGLGSVVCPCCGNYVAHKEFKGSSFVTDIHAIPCTVILEAIRIAQRGENNEKDS